MRPKKRINPGAHRSGTAGNTSKGRYFTTGLPAAPSEPTAAPREYREMPRAETPRESKYVGRASVGPRAHDVEPPIDDLAHAEWVDPLDQDEFDLTQITIDLRPSMIDEPSDSYYQRFSSRVPGHQ
jgi:hypothetical protein